MACCAREWAGASHTPNPKPGHAHPLLVKLLDPGIELERELLPYGGHGWRIGT